MLKDTVDVQFGGLEVVLRGDATAYLPAENALMVADLHLGKDASFRAAGMPVPIGMNHRILDLLANAVQQTKATRLYVLGDLIHDSNSITEDLTEMVGLWVLERRTLEITLVLGNHDRHIQQFPAEWNLATTPAVQFGEVELVHQVDESVERPQIGGHWHPVTNVGRSADDMRLPCFVLESRSLILPAFGPFKGGMKFKINASRTLFPIGNGKVCRVRML